tara:strand:+ start:8589 stop:8885 length:297 start_codon:yes stop_codon:yes gene_type:complete
MTDLKRKDYINILKFYNEPIPHNLKQIKKNALNILSYKLCRCIKKVKRKTRNEKEAIGICRKSVLHTKKIDNYKFKCKKNYKLLPKKYTRKYLKKKLY